MRFTFDDLVAVMAKLRGADGCPWDREQTHASLAPHLIEESHEVLDAIGRGDLAALRAELGDVLLQVVFHAQMAQEAGAFDVTAVTDGLVHKLIDRHPHVFGDVRLGTAREVKARWDEIKRQEEPQRQTFDGVPTSLPALARAQKILERAIPDESRRFDGRTVAAGLRREVEAALALQDGNESRGLRAEAIGDLLVAVAALAEAFGVDAETALRAACERFAARHGT